MRFEFNGYVTKELTSEEEVAFKRLLAEAEPSPYKTQLEMCEDICTKAGRCEMLPCAKNRYGWVADKV